MRSTFYGLEIAKTGLFVSQNQLDVTGHNISNADTIGYTRQRLATQAMPAGFGGTFIGVDNKSTAGRGVNTIHIEQVRNPFLDYQYRKENAVTKEWATKEQYFEYVEALFNLELDSIDTTSGLTASFEKFYNALYALSESPEDQEIRTNVRTTATLLVDAMNYYYERLISQQDTLNESVRISVLEINSIAQDVAKLNEQIYAYELTGAKANDLRDQRNTLLDTLSGIIDIDTFEDTNGRLVVQIGGRDLVRHSTYNQMAVEKDVPNNIKGEQDLYGIYWADSSGKAVTTMPVPITSGALKGYMDVRDGDTSGNMGIPYVIDKLNDMCDKVVKQINAVHSTGYTSPSGANGQSVSGINFFYMPDINANAFIEPANASNFKWSGTINSGTYTLQANGANLEIYDSQGQLVHTAAVTASDGKLDLSMFGFGVVTWTDNGAADADVASAIASAGSITEPKITAKKGSFKLDQAILDDVFNIAASDDLVSVDGEANNQRGNNKIALALC
ncbi:flagellar hook-associated protein FlgK, partial [Christensenellaceae bacterium OttesenSCG-928-K19]|nr:flagellar hook-associated protein FlgK [Christensenellaceae bacterium OttesenSCG-928-K19]